MSEIRTTRTAAKQAKFLENLAENGIISAAAKACGLSRRTLYDWRAADLAFAAAWDEALQIGLDTLQDEAIRRAVVGEELPQFFNGPRRITPRKYSDLLLMFLLRHHRPQQYAVPSPATREPPTLTISANAGD